MKIVYIFYFITTFLILVSVNTFGDEISSSKIFSNQKLKETIFGGGSDGGGNIVYDNYLKNPLLLDLYLKNSRLIDKKTSDYNTQLPLKKIVVKIGKLKIAELIKERFNIWKNNSITLIKLLNQALFNLQMVAIPNYLKQNNRYYLPRNFFTKYPTAKIKTAIIYHKIYWTTISTKRWNELGDLSQAGLILHELFRNVQIRYGFYISEKELQNTVAKILLTTPIQNESLDEINDDIKYLSVSKNRISNKSSEIQETICELFENNILKEFEKMQKKFEQEIIDSCNYLKSISNLIQVEQYCSLVNKVLKTKKYPSIFSDKVTKYLSNLSKNHQDFFKFYEFITLNKFNAHLFNQNILYDYQQIRLEACEKKLQINHKLLLKLLSFSGFTEKPLIRDVINYIRLNRIYGFNLSTTIYHDYNSQISRDLDPYNYYLESIITH